MEGRGEGEKVQCSGRHWVGKKHKGHCPRRKATQSNKMTQCNSGPLKCVHSAEKISQNCITTIFFEHLDKGPYFTPEKPPLQA